jgi:DNA topoisomerase-1
MSVLPKDYTLVVTEKPDVARRIAAALGEDSSQVEGNYEYILCPGKTNYIIVSAVGHLFSLMPTYPRRDIYPVLDTRWVPLSAVDKKRKDVDRRIRTIKSLSKGASKLVIACDYDLEGDTIGYNILKYACGAKKVKAFRAKFSTLALDELSKSFSDLTWHEEWPRAEAGRARHLLDFVWGVNLSRVLLDSLLEAGGRYTTLSIGRVQGPALNYIHDRELEIMAHVPVPYWRAKALVDADGKRFTAEYTVDRIGTEAGARLVKGQVEGNRGTVVEASRRPFAIPPPPSFNLGDLQHEAFQILGFSPSQTLSIAEKLYLQAAISYPRTSSQRIPPSIDCERILSSLARQEAFKPYVTLVMKESLSPAQGQKTDPAHPAIFPTGEPPSGTDAKEWQLYNLIVRRFISAFAERAVKERHSLRIACGRHEFRASATSIISPGWSAIYDFGSEKEMRGLPSLNVADIVSFVTVDVVECFDHPPSRYNQSSLLEQMESDEIGTKATRAEIISTLVDRGYVSGGSIELSELGFAIVDAASKYSPSILSPQMTRSIEEKLDGVEAASLDPGTVTFDGVDQLLSCLRLFEENMAEVGAMIRLANLQTAKGRETLGSCPVCHDGQLIIIRSHKSGKRFVGCSRYSNGCRASAPLPQNGIIRATKGPCKTCGWPVILVFTSRGRRPWRLCVNPDCPMKGSALNRKAVSGGSRS